MLIQLSDLVEEYNRIRASVVYGNVSVLVFIPYTVDSIAAKSILFEMFQKDDILAQYVFVKGYKDLEENIRKRYEDETLPPTIIFINCAGSISFIRKFNFALENTTAYIIDSHRPINIENCDARIENVRVFDDSQSLFDTLLTFPEQPPDEEGGIYIKGKIKTKDGMVREVEKIINPQSQEAKEYATAAYFSDPASIQVYALVSSFNKATSQELWFAILGLSEHFYLEHIDNLKYEALFNALSNEASRLTNGKPLFTTIYDENGEGVVRPETAIQVSVFQDFNISPSNELRCPLLRQWTLIDSMNASTFVASRLRLWYQRGQENLRGLLAKAGILLKDANSNFATLMNRDIRDSLIERFDQQVDTYQLAGFVYPSFILRHGFETELAATDVVLALRAKLVDSSCAAEFSGSRFITNRAFLQDGVEFAKKRARLVVTFGIELMSRQVSTIINSGTFWMTTIRNASEKGFPVDPSYLVELALFLIQALRVEARLESELGMPIVVSALDQTSDSYLIVAVSAGFEFGEVSESIFGELFTTAAEKAEIEIETDAFDSYVCRVKSDAYPNFIDQLTVLALHELGE